MASTLLTSSIVTKESLRVLHQKLNFVGAITREYDDSFAKTGAKIGDSLKIRLPNEYVVRTGKTLVAQDSNESSVTLQVATQKGVDLNFSSADMTLSIDDFSGRYIEPAMSVLAAAIEADALTMYKDVYQQVNNTGSAATFAKFLQARKLMVDSLAPNNDRSVVLNTQDNVDMVDALKGLFQDSSSIAKQYREGVLGKTAGFEFSENTLLPKHLRGAGDGAYTTNTQVGTIPVSSTPKGTITVAAGTGAIPRGEVFTIANVFRVHPETKVSTGVLQQFVAAADYVGGAGDISISPAIITAGARQNVTIPSTATNAGLTIAGTASTAYGVSLAFQKDAFALATADLIMPKGVDMAAREVFDGISMRLVRQYDINNDNMPCRIDVLYGYKTLRPQLAARVANN